ncbi:MAG: putative ef hand family protein [Streblomastix strix]|uniref:Putative ef hand family protein n=1 Tax=Streblomastix strix TaxID=222440 RepID=A0A5J4VW99_9EUKA|nr:MAG: putative ef hand family protein [Streblomastix strix]
MLFQPAVGKNTYHRGVNINNFVEDRALEEHKLKEFLQKQATGQLSTLRAHEIILHSRQRVELKPINPDGFLRFGDQIQLENVFTESVVASDFGDEITIEEDKDTYATTCTPIVAPMLRNVFVIERPPEEFIAAEDLLNDVLHFNQNFVLRAHPDYTARPFYLASVLTTPQLHSRYSKQQLVFLTDEKKFSSAWKVWNWDPQLRADTDGDPVRTTLKDGVTKEVFVIVHSHTGIPLGADKIKYANIFGNEHELFCKNDVDNHRAQTKKNYWNLITA